MHGDQLKSLREHADMSRAELAAALDMSPTFLSFLERGVRPIDRRTQLAALYVMSVRHTPIVPDLDDGRPLVSLA